MRICKECIERALEATQNWLEEGYEGGVVVHPHSHFDQLDRRECPGFVFHWGLESTDSEDWDDDDDE